MKTLHAYLLHGRSEVTLTCDVSLRRLLASGTILASGCAQILGADEYSRDTQEKSVLDSTPTPPETVSIDSASPAVPVGRKAPFLTDATCLSCVTNVCAGQMSQCEAASFCSQWLADIRANPDPIAGYERYKKLTSEMWNGGHGGPDASTTVSSLIDCASSNCLVQCQIGQDFSCVNQFDWAVAFPSRLRTRFTDPVGQPSPSAWQVRACLASDVGCSNPLAVSQTDEKGFATLELHSASQQYSTFGGFLLFDGAAGYNAWTTIVSRPFATDDYSPWQLPNQATIEAWFKLFGREFDPNYGYVWVLPADCLSLAAKQVYLNAQIETPDGLVPCDECRYAYQDDSGQPDSRRGDFSSAGSLGFVSFVPARQIELTVRQSGTDRVVGIQRLAVAAGRVHFVKLYPASRAQLKAAHHAGPD